jgi:hypothetical protein
MHWLVVGVLLLASARSQCAWEPECQTHVASLEARIAALETHRSVVETLLPELEMCCDAIQTGLLQAADDSNQGLSDALTEVRRLGNDTLLLLNCTLLGGPCRAGQGVLAADIGFAGLCDRLESSGQDGLVAAHAMLHALQQQDSLPASKAQLITLSLGMAAGSIAIAAMALLLARSSGAATGASHRYNAVPSGSAS